MGSAYSQELNNFFSLSSVKIKGNVTQILWSACSQVRINETQQIQDEIVGQ